MVVERAYTVDPSYVGVAPRWRHRSDRYLPPTADPRQWVPGSGQLGYPQVRQRQLELALVEFLDARLSH